jgi:hypothetical protein
MHCRRNDATDYPKNLSAQSVSSVSSAIQDKKAFRANRRKVKPEIRLRIYGIAVYFEKILQERATNGVLAKRRFEQKSPKTPQDPRLKTQD